MTDDFPDYRRDFCCGLSSSCMDCTGADEDYEIRKTLFETCWRLFEAGEPWRQLLDDEVLSKYTCPKRKQPNLRLVVNHE